MKADDKNPPAELRIVGDLVFFRYRFNMLDSTFEISWTPEKARELAKNLLKLADFLDPPEEPEKTEVKK